MLGTASVSTWLIVMALFVGIVGSLMVIGIRQRPQWGLASPKGPWRPPISLPPLYRRLFPAQRLLYGLILVGIVVSKVFTVVAVIVFFAIHLLRLSLVVTATRDARREGRAVFGDRMPADWREALEGWIDHRVRDRPGTVTLQLPVTVGGWGSRTVQEQIDLADRRMESHGYGRVATKDQPLGAIVTYAVSPKATDD